MWNENPWEIIKAYGSDFFKGIMAMPLDIQKAVVTLYKFVRIPDQMVDDITLDSAEKLKQVAQMLEQYYVDWKLAYDNKDVLHPKFGEVVAVFYKYGVDFQYSADFFKSMIMDTYIFQYPSYDNLKEYVYGAADVVGLMMTQIMGYNFDKDKVENAEKLKKVKYCAAKLGEAFQLSNFLRDVHEDLLLGRVYLPQDILVKYGICNDDLMRYHLAQEVDKKFVECMTELVDMVDAMHDEANEWIVLLNPLCQKAIRLSSDLHRWILQRIEDNNYNVFDKKFQKTSYWRLLA